MKRILTVVLFAVMTVCSTCVLATAPATPPVAAEVAAPDAAAPMPTPVDTRDADHEALRALMRTATEAINTRKFDLVTPLLHPSFTVIAADNTKLVGIDAFRDYWTRLFEGPDAMMISIEAKPVADELTYFLDDNIGVVYGTSADTYTFRKNSVFKEGEQRTMNTRFSAVVMREGADWKLVNVHFSANPFDNPMLDISKRYATHYALIAGIAGLVLGALLMMVLRRR